MRQLSKKILRQRIKATINKLADADGCVAGSLVKISRKCGRPNCRCATGGPKHEAYLLSSKVKGKTKSVYVPVNLIEEVQQWVNEHRQIKDLLKQIDRMSEQIIRQHVKASRAAKLNRDASRAAESKDAGASSR